MQKIKEFKEYDKKQALNEIYQTSGMRFAFMSAPKDGNLQSTPWVKCRDYLHDAFRAYVHKSSCKIFGFSYDFDSDPPIDIRRIRMLVKSTNKKTDILKKDVMSGVKLINHYEDIAEIKQRTKRYEVEPGIWIVNGPNFWFKSPVLTSMFTFLLRLGEQRIEFESDKDLIAKLKAISDPGGNNDAKYLCDTYDKMSVIVKNYDAIFLKGKKYEKCITQEEKIISIGNYHNYMGIRSFCTGAYKYAPSYTAFKVFLEEGEKEEIIEDVIEDVALIEEQKKGLKPNKKKQLIRIETPYHKDIYENYVASSFYMSMVSSPKTGRKQCFQFTSCKELLFASMRASLSEIEGVKDIPFNTRTTGGPAVDTNRTRLLITVGGVDRGNGKINKVKNELFFAKKVLNKYEKQFGMTPSVISTVKLKHKEGLSTAWLFTGSSEWLSNPVLLSIYILIIRAAKTAAGTIGTIDDLTMPKLFSYWKKFYKYVGSKNPDAVLFKYYDEITRIVQRRKEVFEGDILYNYFADNGEISAKYYKKVGIMSLLDGVHIDTDMVKKVKDIGII